MSDLSVKKHIDEFEEFRPEDRLRGMYIKHYGDGYVTSWYETTPIQHEAAAELERLRDAEERAMDRVDELTGIIAELKDQIEWRNIQIRLLHSQVDFLKNMFYPMPHDVVEPAGGLPSVVVKARWGDVRTRQAG